MPEQLENPDIEKSLEDLRVAVGANAVMLSRFTAEKQIVMFSASDAHDPPLPDEFALEDSICGHVHGMDFPLIINDAQSHPLVRDNPLVRGNVVGAYAGFPIHNRAGDAVAVLCAFYDRMNLWTDRQKSNISDCAVLLSSIWDDGL